VISEQLSSFACKVCFEAGQSLKDHALRSWPHLSAHRLLRQTCQTDRERVIYLQACFRRNIARKELKNLKQEARSVTHFKEVSYKLENKVVELTQTLQKRTTENKGLQSKLSSLEDQLQSWMSKYDDAATKAKELKSKVDQPVVALPEFVALESQKQELDTKLADSLRKIEAQEYVTMYASRKCF